MGTDNGEGSGRVQDEKKGRKDKTSHRRKAKSSKENMTGFIGATSTAGEPNYREEHVFPPQQYAFPEAC